MIYKQKIKVMNKLEYIIECMCVYVCIEVAVSLLLKCENNCD